MTRLAASLAGLALGLALACGKYGPPVRAGAEAEPEDEIRRSGPEERAPDPEREEEPPPEGAP